MKNIKFKDLPPEVVEFLNQLPNGPDGAEESFKTGFVDVYPSLRKWALSCYHGIPGRDWSEFLRDFLESLGDMDSSPVYADYVLVDGKYYCFVWA